MSSMTNRRKNVSSKSKPIRIQVKCSWSGARLVVPQNTLTIKSTLSQIIASISDKLPPMMTNESSWDDPQPCLVYMRTNVLKRDWSVTTIADLVSQYNTTAADNRTGGRSSSTAKTATATATDSISLTLNLPSERTVTPATQKYTAAAADVEPPRDDDVKNNVNENPNTNDTSTQSQKLKTNKMNMSEAEPMDIDDVTESITPTVPVEQAPSAITSKQALVQLLKFNFDTSSKECLFTIIKIIDNILSKPFNTKVRSLKCSNAMVHKKIIGNRGGMNLLLAIGFTFDDNNHYSLGHGGFDFDFDHTRQMNQEEEAHIQNKVLVLKTENENTQDIQSIRADIVQVLMQELKVPSDDIPNASVAAKPVLSTAMPNNSSSGNTTFNPYKTHSFNAQAASKGVTDPFSSANREKSSTERQLETLKIKEMKLKKEMENQFIDRNMIALLPNHANPIVTLASSDHDQGTKGDSSLLMSKLKKQNDNEEKGFTTKAMRDLEKLKKQKIYSHAQLRICFPDGSRIEAKFLPTETISVVKEQVRSAFVEELRQSLDFELYISPPKRTLDISKSLSDEGLVPAAKIFVSWKDGKSLLSPLSPGSFLNPTLFQATSVAQTLTGGNQNTTAFPESKPLIENKKEGKVPNATGNADGPKDALTREEEMMKKMLGKRKGLLWNKKESDKSSANSNTNNDKQQGRGKPKWFKG